MAMPEIKNAVKLAATPTLDRLWAPGVRCTLRAHGTAVGLPSDDVPSHWVAYIGVADLDRAAARAEALGGRLLVQPTRFDEPANVYFALAADPTGAAFGLLEV